LAFAYFGWGGFLGALGTLGLGTLFFVTLGALGPSKESLLNEPPC